MAYQVRQTDFAANKGVNGIWLLKLDGMSQPVRLTAQGASSAGSCWSSDGRSVYYTAAQDGTNRLGRIDIAPALSEREKDSKALMRGAFEANPQAAVVSSGTVGSMSAASSCRPTATCADLARRLYRLPRHQLP